MERPHKKSIRHHYENLFKGYPVTSWYKGKEGSTGMHQTRAGIYLPALSHNNTQKEDYHAQD